MKREEDQGHERSKQNAREPLSGRKAAGRRKVVAGQSSGDGQAEVPMVEGPAMPERTAQLLDYWLCVGSALALAQSLKAMGAACAEQGREGHAVVARRAERFVRVMHMQVTRFLKQPDCRLRHPAHDMDLLAAHVDVGDNGQVMVGCTDVDGGGWLMLPLDELVAAGPINDAVRAMVGELSKAMVHDLIGQAIDAGGLPGFDTFEEAAGVEQGWTERDANGDLVECADWQHQPEVHHLQAHPEYVLGEDTHAEPVADLPLDGQ